MTLGGKFAGFTECWDFPMQRVRFVCFLFGLSTLAHTSRLMLSGAIPDNKYNSSKLVGLRHPMIARHALLSPESSLQACADLAHTGAAYSATE